MNINQTSENAMRLKAMAKQMRLDALDMGRSAGSGGAHFGGGLSCIEIFAVLYGEVLSLDPQNPEWAERDRFLTSKWHCLLAWYPALSLRGYFPREELFEFKKDGGRLNGYPRNVALGLEYSGGSLGMALPAAVGMALAAKEKKQQHRVYVLLGDGELAEGSNWEAIMSAAQFGLGNLTVIIDRNRLSYDGNTEELMALDDLSARFTTFRWQAIPCDGHDVADLLRAFSEINGTQPSVIIAETVKGKGVSFMEHRPEWHQKAISAAQYEQARNEVLAAE